MVRTKGYSDTPQTESSRRASPFCNGSREPLNPINTSSAPRKNAPQWGAPAWCGRRDSNPHGCPQEPEDVHSSWFLMINCNLPKKFPKMSHSFYSPGLSPGSFLPVSSRAGEASIYQPFPLGTTLLRFDGTSRSATSFQFEPSFQRRRTAPYKIQPSLSFGEAFVKKRNRYINYNIPVI